MPNQLRPTEYGAQVTLGVAVPQANPTVEPEFWTLVPDDVNVLATRLSGSRTDSHKRLTDYLDNLQVSLDAYDNAKLDAVGFANTGTSYLIGADEEARRIDAFSAAAGYPIVTAARAIRDALRSLGASRIALFAPYPDWLVAAGQAYWKAAGLKITDTATVSKDTSDTRNVYGVGFSDIIKSTDQLKVDDADVIVMTGTGRAVGASQHEEGPARGLPGAKPGIGRSGDRCLRREIRSEVRQGGRVPDQGSQHVACALRLSCRALGSLADDQSNRKRVCDGPAQDGAFERFAVVNDCQVDGVQAARRRIENLAAAERHKSVAEDHRRCQILRMASRSSTCRQITPAFQRKVRKGPADVSSFSPAASATGQTSQPRGG
jgi:maleate isomerase